MNLPPESVTEPRFVRPPRVLLAIIVFALLAIPIGLVALRVARGPGIPAADLSTYRAARERWQANRVKDYEIEIRVEGRQPATYRAQVKNGEPQAAFRNDQPLRQQRTFHTWTVEGMFETLAGDMSRLAPDGPQREVRRDPPFVLRVRYDDRYGYPAEYHRSEYGTGIDVEWRVVRFTPHEATAHD